MEGSQHFQIVFINRNELKQINLGMQNKSTALHKFHTSIQTNKVTEEMPAVIRVGVTFSLLYSAMSQDYTQTVRQVTYYVFFLPARNNAFAIESKACAQ